jgi:hypothetical protein
MMPEPLRPAFSAWMADILPSPAPPTLKRFHRSLDQMKRNIVLLGLALALVGCGNNGAQVSPQVASDAATASTVSQPTQATDATSSSATTAPEGDASKSLPEGVVLNPSYILRKDWNVAAKNGASNRRTEFEYQGETPAQVMTTFAASMLAAGFTAATEPSTENGIVRQSFKKPKYGTVFARAQDFQTKSGKSAGGILVMSWPNPAQGAPSAVATP